MVQINDRVLTAATQRGQNLLNEEVVALIERYHPHEQPGISRETLEAYATALANDPIPIRCRGILRRSRRAGH